eukprot:Opistho-2@43241
MDEVCGDAAARSAERVAEGDGTAVGVGPVPVETKLLLACKILRRKRLVDFDKVDIRNLEPGLVEGACDGSDWANAHDLGVASAHMPRDEAREGLETVLLDGGLRCDHNGTGTVADARGIAGSDNTVLLEDGRELAKRLQSRLGACMLVRLEELGALLALELNRGDLGVEPALRLSLGPSLLALERISINIGAADLVLLGEVFRGDCHGQLHVRVREGRPQRILLLDLLAEARAKADVTHGIRCLAHVLGARRKNDRGITSEDLLGTVDHALETRSTQAVHCKGSRGDAHAAAESNVAGEVRCVGRGLRNIANNDRIDNVWADICGGKGSLGRIHGEVRGSEVLQLATKRAKSSALSGDNENSGAGCHFFFLFCFFRVSEN